MTAINPLLAELQKYQPDGSSSISSPSNWDEEAELHVETDLDEIADQLSGELSGFPGGNGRTAGKWFFIVGAPGGGKSAFLGRIRRNLEAQDFEFDTGNEQQGEQLPFVITVKEKGKNFPFAMLVNDASVMRDHYDPDSNPAKDLLFSVLVDAAKRGISLVVCANSGLLETAIGLGLRNNQLSREDWFRVWHSALDNTESEKSWTTRGKKAVFDEIIVQSKTIEGASLVRGSSIANRLVEKINEHEGWLACEGCDALHHCPFMANRKWLSDSGLRERFLCLLSRVEAWNGQVIVFRELLSFLSIIYSGCAQDYSRGGLHPCEWVQDRVKKHKKLSLVARRLYALLWSGTTTAGSLPFERWRANDREGWTEFRSDLEENTGKRVSRLVDEMSGKSSLPNGDVGLAHLLGHAGSFSLITPERANVPRDFRQQWGTASTGIASKTGEHSTDIEQELFEDLASIADHLAERGIDIEQASALERWWSRIVLWIGATVDAVSLYGEPIDEYVGLLQKQMDGELSGPERREMQQSLQGIIGGNPDGNDELVRISDAVSVKLPTRLTVRVPKQADATRQGSPVLQVLLGTTVVNMPCAVYCQLLETTRFGLNIGCIPRELIESLVQARSRVTWESNYGRQDGTELQVFGEDGLLMGTLVSDDSKDKEGFTVEAGRDG